MALQIVATSIGNPGDITLRARDALLTADLVIGEERKEVSKLLKALGRENPEIRLLNEHSTDADVEELLEICGKQTVALVSDAGTPGFCDPGARLVAACRKAGVAMTTLPGASSLMCLLSLSGTRLDQFVFRGFLPAERESRALAIRDVARESRPVVLMDTPYRLGKLLAQLAETIPTRRALLGLDFTLPSEDVWEGTLADLAARFGERKAEFMLLLYPSSASVDRAEKAPEQIGKASGSITPRSQPRGDERPSRHSDKSGGERRRTPGRKFGRPGRHKR